MNQLKKIAKNLIVEFGNASHQELIIVDIDQSARPTYAKKREGATTGKCQKRGQKCLQWSVAFSAGEVIDQQLKEGYRHCIDDFKERYQQTRKVLGRIDILRIDGGYLSIENLQFLREQRFCTKASLNLNCVKDGLKRATDHYWKRVDKHTKVFDCGLMEIFPELDRKYRLILVKGQKRMERRIPKNQRKKGTGYRASRITYQEIIFAILTNLEGHSIHVYEFYKQRQTIENYFRDSNWSFEIGKLPSQQFQANQAYLWLMSLVQNVLLWFKHQCLPDHWQSASYQKIRDELINHKALVTEKPSYVQINFSVFFRHQEIHDFAAQKLEQMKTHLDHGDSLNDFWQFATKPSLPSSFDIAKLKSKFN